MTLDRDVGGGTQETPTVGKGVGVQPERLETCPKNELGNDHISYALQHDL